MIAINHITKSFDGIEAITNITLQVNPSSSCVIVGPSGSGKTTLLRLIAGLEIPDSGEVYIDGILASSNSFTLEPHKRNLGFVFQSPALWPHMTVAQNILFGMNGKSKHETLHRLDELLVNICMERSGHRFPHQLSGGESRRVSLARSLATQPKYLLMDEPLINLDNELKIKMLFLIKGEISRTGAGLIYVTHDTDEALDVSARVIRLTSGRVVES